MHKKLLGLDGFYDRVALALRVPYEPIRWVQDAATSEESETTKPARIAELVHAYRSRGHLMADVDPLSSRPRKHPDLDVQTHGLTLWDLDRTYPTPGFGGKERMKMREMLSTCFAIRTAAPSGVEYMYIADPERKWLQERWSTRNTAPPRASMRDPREARRGRELRALPARRSTWATSASRSRAGRRSSRCSTAS